MSRVDPERMRKEKAELELTSFLPFRPSTPCSYLRQTLSASPLLSPILATDQTVPPFVYSSRRPRRGDEEYDFGDGRRLEVVEVLRRRSGYLSRWLVLYVFPRTTRLFILILTNSSPSGWAEYVVLADTTPIKIRSDKLPSSSASLHLLQLMLPSAQTYSGLTPESSPSTSSVHLELRVRQLTG